jgi:hypothetical protein
LIRRLADLDQRRRRVCGTRKHLECSEFPRLVLNVETDLKNRTTLPVQVLAYRRMDCGLGEALLLYMKWVPFFVVFFGGMSYHVSTALLAHLFGYNSKP